MTYREESSKGNIDQVTSFEKGKAEKNKLKTKACFHDNTFSELQR